MFKDNVHFSFLRFIVAVGLTLSSSAVESHESWTQRNEPGSWTMCLYHCDEKILETEGVLENAGWNRSLDLIIEPPEDVGFATTHATRHDFLDRAIVGLSPQTGISAGVVKCPTGDLSLECWLRFLENNADMQFGFVEGVSLHIRIAGEGDRFELLGTNTSMDGAARYGAPGFQSFPPAGTWHHYGVTIHSADVHALVNGNFEYGAGSYAMFYYDSHIVGFVNQTKIDLSGLAFAPQSHVFIRVHHGSMAFDEIMVSEVDWSDPVGHGGVGHSGLKVGHAFEDGRMPASTILHREVH